VTHTDNVDGTADRRSSLRFAPNLALEWEHGIGRTPLSLSLEFEAQSSRNRRAADVDEGEIGLAARLDYDFGKGRDDQRPVFYIAAARSYTYDRSFRDRGGHENEYTVGMDFAVYRDRAGRRLPASADSTTRAAWMFGLPVALSRQESESTTLTFTPNVNHVLGPRWDFDLATELAWARFDAEAEEDDEDTTRERTFSFHPVATLTYWFPRGLLGAKARLHFQAGYSKVRSNQPDNSSRTWEIGPILRLEW
jgi:hypothetical protein